MGLVGLPGIFNNTHVELGLHRQNVITHLVDSGERIVFTPKQVSLESESGKSFSTRASTPGQPLPGRPPIPNGTSCTRVISAVTRFGGISQPPSFTPILASRRKRSNPGMRTESVGGCCRSPFLAGTRRTLASNTFISARTGLSEDISTLSISLAGLGERTMRSNIEE